MSEAEETIAGISCDRCGEVETRDGPEHATSTVTLETEWGDETNESHYRHVVLCAQCVTDPRADELLLLEALQDCAKDTLDQDAKREERVLCADCVAWLLKVQATARELLRSRPHAPTGTH